MTITRTPTNTTSANTEPKIMKVLLDESLVGESPLWRCGVVCDASVDVTGLVACDSVAAVVFASTDTSPSFVTVCVVGFDVDIFSDVGFGFDVKDVVIFWDDVVVVDVNDTVDIPGDATSEDAVVFGSSVDVVVVVVTGDDVVAVVVVVGAGVDVVVSGSTSGGSTCIVSDICFEQGLVAPSVAKMTTSNLPAVSGDTRDDIRPEVGSMSKVSRTTLSVLAAKLIATSPLSPKSSSVTSMTTAVVLTSVDMLTKWMLPESGLWNTGQWSFTSRTRMWS